MISRTLAGNFSVGSFLRLARSKLGVSGSGELEANFTRNDTNLIWALTRIHIVDNRFPTGPGTESFRLAKAEEVLREETDYTVRATALAELSAPSDDEIARVLDIVTHHAPAEEVFE